MTLYIVARKHKDLIYKNIDEVSIKDSIYGIATTRSNLEKLIKQCVKDYWGNLSTLTYDEDTKKLLDNKWKEYEWFEVEVCKG